MLFIHTPLPSFFVQHFLVYSISNIPFFAYALGGPGHCDLVGISKIGVRKKAAWSCQVKTHGARNPIRGMHTVHTLIGRLGAVLFFVHTWDNAVDLLYCTCPIIFSL